MVSRASLLRFEPVSRRRGWSRSASRAPHRRPSSAIAERKRPPVRARIEVVVPDSLTDLGAGKHPAAATRASCSSNANSRGVNSIFRSPRFTSRVSRFTVRSSTARRLCRFAAARRNHRLKTRNQLFDVERFGEIVIGAEVESFEALVPTRSAR